MSSRLETIERQMEDKTREMSLTSSHGQMQIREEMESLKQAREKVRVECGLLQAKTEGLSMHEERRYVVFHIGLFY